MLRNKNMKGRAAPASGGVHLFHCVSAMSLRERAINFTGATMGMSKLTRLAAIFSPRWVIYISPGCVW